eukprot:scaffold601616_cov41-Prasinocladus_malaysianus.AAC.2
MKPDQLRAVLKFLKDASRLLVSHDHSWPEDANLCATWRHLQVGPKQDDECSTCGFDHLVQDLLRRITQGDVARLQSYNVFIQLFDRKFMLINEAHRETASLVTK